jgi:hypothetical protein
MVGLILTLDIGAVYGRMQVDTRMYRVDVWEMVAPRFEASDRRIRFLRQLI